MNIEVQVQPQGVPNVRPYTQQEIEVMAGMKGVEARVVKHTIDTSRYEDAIGRFPDQTDHFQARIDRSARGVERFQSRMAAIGGSAVSHVSQAETSYAEVRYSLPA